MRVLSTGVEWMQFGNEQLHWNKTRRANHCWTAISIVHWCSSVMRLMEIQARYEICRLSSPPPLGGFILHTSSGSCGSTLTHTRQLQDIGFEAHKTPAIVDARKSTARVFLRSNTKWQTCVSVKSTSQPPSGRYSKNGLHLEWKRTRKGRKCLFHVSCAVLIWCERCPGPKSWLFVCILKSPVSIVFGFLMAALFFFCVGIFCRLLARLE